MDDAEKVASDLASETTKELPAFVPNWSCQKPDTGVPGRAARLGWGGEGGLRTTSLTS